MKTRSRPGLSLAFLVWIGAAAFAPAADGVSYRKDPTAAEQVGAMLLDAKGNRVVADSLREAQLVVILHGAEADAATRDLLPAVAAFARDPKHATRVEVVALDAGGARETLLRLLRAAGWHAYGVEPGSTAAQALARRIPADKGPALLALEPSGRVFAETGAQSATPAPADLLRAAERLLAEQMRTPVEIVAAGRVDRDTRRAELAARLRQAPDQVGDAEIQALYPVEGMLKGKGGLGAMINQRVVRVGDTLEFGARVVAIEDQKVVIEFGGRRVPLGAAPIQPSGGR